MLYHRAQRPYPTGHWMEYDSTRLSEEEITYQSCNFERMTMKRTCHYLDVAGLKGS